MNGQIAEYSQTEAALAELRQRYEGVRYEVATTAGDKAARAARAEVKGYRVALEKMRVELKAPALERTRLIDAEAKRITAELLALEEPIDAQIKAEEQRVAAEKAEKARIEQERIENIRAKISEIRDMPATVIGSQSDRIKSVSDSVALRDITLDEFAEFTGEARQAKANAILQFNELIEKAQEQEAEQERIRLERAELERLRAEDAERARVAAQERAAADAKAKAEREAAEEAIRAERAAHEAELRAQREQQEAEQRRIAVELMKLVADHYGVDTAIAVNWLANYDFGELLAA